MTATPATNGNGTTPTTQTEPATERRLRPSEVKRRNLEHQLQAAADQFGQDREDLQGYAEAGIFYGSASPVPNSFGAELGVVTKDEKTGTVQRTGFGFYFRSDHICNKKYDGNVPVC